MIRAAELTAPETRAKLANAIDGLVAVADHPGRVSHTVPYAKIYRSAVYREREALLRLAERLRERTPVSVEAIALLATMLWHKDSPIYDRDRARIAVGNIVASCWDVLEPARPGHERRPQR